MWAQKTAARLRQDLRNFVPYPFHDSDAMPGPSNTLLIEGSFSELADELAQFIDGVSKPENGSGAQADAAPVLEQIQKIEQAEDPASVDQAKLEELKNDALKKIVTKASALNNAPEKGVEDDPHRQTHTDNLGRIHGGVQSPHQSLFPVLNARPAARQNLPVP